MHLLSGEDPDESQRAWRNSRTAPRNTEGAPRARKTGHLSPERVLAA
jgi:hypothetical protein